MVAPHVTSVISSGNETGLCTPLQTCFAGLLLFFFKNVFAFVDGDDVVAGGNRSGTVGEHQFVLVLSGAWFPHSRLLDWKHGCSKGGVAAALKMGLEVGVKLGLVQGCLELWLKGKAKVEVKTGVAKKIEIVEKTKKKTIAWVCRKTVPKWIWELLRIPLIIRREKIEVRALTTRLFLPGLGAKTKKQKQKQKQKQKKKKNKTKQEKNVEHKPFEKHQSRKKTSVLKNKVRHRQNEEKKKRLLVASGCWRNFLPQ